MKKREISTYLVHILFFIIVLFCIVPLFMVFSVSLSNSDEIMTKGYSFFPQGLNFDAYKFLFNDGGRIANAYKITIIITVVGTFLSLLITAQLAYSLSRKDYKYNKIFSFFVYFTMLFNGGLIPTYILMTQYLNLKDTIWALIVSALVSPWNVMLMRTFFEETPFELTEAAYIDGANDTYIFYKIILPLSKPVLATVGSFIALGYWNEWFAGLLYITKSGLEPLQYLLYKISQNMEELQKQLSFFNSTASIFPQEPSRMAMAVIAAGPILLIFMFTQKYFVKGLTLGSVKG